MKMKSEIFKNDKIIVEKKKKKIKTKTKKGKNVIIMFMCI